MAEEEKHRVTGISTGLVRIFRYIFYPSACYKHHRKMAKLHCTKKQMAELDDEHGAVSPPYFMYPEIHPYAIFWRMGHGEGYIVLFGAGG